MSHADRPPRNSILRGGYRRLDSDDARYERFEAKCRQGHESDESENKGQGQR